jgi:hypothetical protein
MVQYILGSYDCCYLGNGLIMSFKTPKHISKLVYLRFVMHYVSEQLTNKKKESCTFIN